MNDIYEQKAKKYKYKYLKLKKQYIAEGGIWPFDDLVKYFSSQAPIQEQKQPKAQAPIQPKAPIQEQKQPKEQAPIQAQEQPDYLMDFLNPVIKPVTEVINNVIKYVTFYNLNYEIEYIGEGGFGCIISPPLQFNNTINTININSIIKL